ncbi:MAG: hypothetical protein QM731_13315 [Chitinophagaceae bacterium]
MKIRLIILTFFLILVSVSCFSQIRIAEGREAVLNKIVTFFAKKGIAIQTLDRPTGLIVSVQQSFLEHYCYLKNGEPKTPGSLVILTDGVKEDPSVVSGYYNIVLKEEGNATEVNASIANLQAYYEKRMRGYSKKYAFSAKSSGVFEKELFDFLNK